MVTTPKKKICILGGGLGSITAAYYLSSTQELRDRYDIEVHQMGWRLGGKGATGRNTKAGDRIEEHGIHLFMGFYENSFKMIREVYEEWERDPNNPLKTWKDAFIAQYHFTLQDRFEKDGKVSWKTWNLTFPKLPGEPGDGTDPLIDPYSPGIGLLKFLQHAIDGYLDSKENSKQPEVAHSSWLHRLIERSEKAVKDEAFGIKSKVLSEVSTLLSHCEDNEIENNHWLHGVFELLDGLLDKVMQEVDDIFVDIESDLYRLWSLLDFGIAALKGYLVDVFPHGDAGWEKINSLDFRTWLISHGGHPTNIKNASFIRGFYDMIFAYRGGDTQNPDAAQAAAGTMFKVIFRLALTYKDAPMFHMKAGMGDTLFSPLYEVLKKRGVSFKFFSKLKNLKLSPNKNQVQTIELIQQATLKKAAEYAPLINVKNIPCWPAEPLWDQLEDGEKLRSEGANFESYWEKERGTPYSLEQGKDFDIAILGVSVAGLQDVASELIEENASWAALYQHVPTVVTQAFQMWTTKTSKQLGWNAPQTVMTAYKEPLDTWADMEQTISTENWPPQAQPKGVAYFCGPMKIDLQPKDKKAFPSEAKKKVKENALSWLETASQHIWPKSQKEGKFNFNFLVDVENGSELQRFEAQYFRANIDPSEQYVLSTPGSIRYRFKAHETGFVNLFVAGDWLKTSINAGSAEAAVEGGMQAAQAISGTPSKISP